MIDFLNGQPFLTLLLIVSLGYFAGRIRIRGFSLESSGILFVALLAGHLGVTMDPVFKTFGLALFISAVGLQAGPRFFHFFQKEGLVLNLVAISLVSAGALVSLVFILLAGMDRATAIGVFAGALTSTPGLAAAQEATSSTLTSIGYGMAYPVGVLLVIFYVKLLPRVLRIDPRQEAREEKRSERSTPVKNRLIRVTNPAVFQKSLRELRLPRTAGVIVSRVRRKYDILVPDKDTCLQHGDTVRLVGTPEALNTAEIMLGKRVRGDLPKGQVEMRRFIVTNKTLVGKTVEEIALKAGYHVNITRIIRNGIDLPATAVQRIEYGDRVQVVGETDLMPALREKFGNDIKQASAGNIFSIILGISFGMLIGLVPISIGQVVRFQMGITGGILLSALVLSNRPKLGLMIWRAPTAIVNFIREMGLVLFLAAVGTASGGSLLAVIRQQGLQLLGMSLAVALLPMILTAWLCRRRLRISLLPLTGILTGGMTSTPGLGVASSLADSSSPMMMYASVYPVAMVTMIVWAKVLAVV